MPIVDIFADPDGVAETEADHFMKCPGCGEWFDMRDLDQLLAHVHDAEIEIKESPRSRRANECNDTVAGPPDTQ